MVMGVSTSTADECPRMSVQDMGDHGVVPPVDGDLAGTLGAT